MKKIIWGIALLFCTSMAANAQNGCKNSAQKSCCKRMRFLWKLELFALNSSFYKQIFKKKLGDSDKKAYLCSNKSHHASQRCVPRWDFAFYLRYMEEDQLHHLYKSGSTFEQAINLYLFDKELRQLIFKAIQDIEISLRTKMIQMFSMEHGAFWFMDSSLFKNEEFYEGCLDNIKKEVSRSNEDFIKEHSQKYTYPALPPVWKTLEVVSFGTLSKLFCLFKDNRLKKQVARELGLPQYTYLESWIRCITVLRNCCAHHARIWNRRFALKPQLPNRLPLQWITPSQKPIKLYHQLCTLLYLEQTITPCMDLKSSLFKLFAEYPNVDLHAMGFPQDWENEPLWRL